MSKRAPLPFDSLFAKDVDKKINGVIKANDAKDLADEIDEYVLTNEVQTHLESFLEDYADPANHVTNGVWISGFFGSGKSHLLKMLSHILGDVPEALVDNAADGPRLSRQQIVDTFIGKAREQGEETLVGDLERVLTIPATSILFNIDQKSDKSNGATALLYAFIRVFDEACGYFGKNPYIAKFERDLANNGQLEDFKSAFEQETGKPWSEGRDEAVLWDEEIGEAYAKVTGKAAQESIIERYEKTYKAAVSDFSDAVKQWLDRQEPNHRIVFLVDEVGQFIGENTELMLQLQSVAEDLAVKTNGRAWAVVTSQEDMDTIVGDRTKKQSYDFSKIQARFAIKLKLSSTDVIEVIQKRLLAKTSEATYALQDLWYEQNANFGTLFDFSDADGKGKISSLYRNRADEEGFIDSYPFVDYEFKLFQEVLRNMSAYNMFDGRHASVGERSMLAAFSATLRANVKDRHAGDLVPFDELYDGISATIQSMVNYRIKKAEDHFGKRDMHVRLLKVLLLVKHVKGFPANPRNLRILLTDKFNDDVLARENEIKQALQELEHDTYIQRVGDQYEYLTNEEQDIEQEIKNVDIDSNMVVKQFVEYFIHQLGGRYVVEYGKQKAPFRFGLQVDGVQSSAQQPIWLNIITSLDDDDREEAINLTMGAPRNIITMVRQDNDRTLFDDIRMVEQTETYHRRSDKGEAESSGRRTALDGKYAAIARLKRGLDGRMAGVMQQCAFYINGNRVEVSSNDPQQRIAEGLRTLIGRYYTNFPMLGDAKYDESDLVNIIAGSRPDETSGMDGDVAIAGDLGVAAEDMLATISRECRNAAGQVDGTVTVKKLIDQYEAAPYGWPYAMILACVGRLYGTERIEMTLDDRPVQRTEAVAVLRNNRKQELIRLSIPRVYDARKVIKLRDFAKEFCEIKVAEMPSSPVDLAAKVKTALLDQADELTKTRQNNARYAFVSQLSEPIETMRVAANHGETWLLDTFTDDDTEGGAEDLLEVKVNVIEPIRGFLVGNQHKVFDEHNAWLQSNRENALLMDADTQQLLEQAQELTASPNLYRGNMVNRFKDLVTRLRDQVNVKIVAERDTALQTLDDVKTTLEQSEEYQSATANAQRLVHDQLDRQMNAVKSSPFISAIQQAARDLRDHIYPQLLKQLADSVPEPQPVESVEPESAEDHPGGCVMPRVQREEHPKSKPIDYVPITTISLPKPKPRLESVDDVDDFLDAYRRELIAAIEQGKRILL